MSDNKQAALAQRICKWLSPKGDPGMAEIFLIAAVIEAYDKHAAPNLPAGLSDNTPVQLLCIFKLGDLREIKDQLSRVSV